MVPEYILYPIIMGQVTNIINSIKSSHIFIDIFIYLSIYLLFILFKHIDYNMIKNKIYIFLNIKKKKSTIILESYENKKLSFKFRAIMNHLVKCNKNIYKIREIIGNNNNRDNEDEYMVDQSKPFNITTEIIGLITNCTVQQTEESSYREKKTISVEFYSLYIYSYTLSINELNEWIKVIVDNYKNKLKDEANEHQLYITAAPSPDKGESCFDIDFVKWDSTITFENSYFHDIDNILKKINFFLNNKEWYKLKGIPYNLGILLYGEPGCGKTRFIKQLMNHTKRHGIDIKLNDNTNYNDLYNVIFEEEISHSVIIPQKQRILIFEDIDAMGEAVKCRDKKEKKNDISDNEIYFEENNKEIKALTNVKFLKQSNNNNLSYLLNMLDGINECCGRIVIMTTNKPEELDKALIRPGRIDITIHLQKCTIYDIMRQINLFWNKNFTEEDILPDIDMKYTSADIYSIFRSTDDFDDIHHLFIQK